MVFSRGEHESVNEVWSYMSLDGRDGMGASNQGPYSATDSYWSRASKEGGRRLVPELVERTLTASPAVLLIRDASLIVKSSNLSENYVTYAGKV